MTRVLYCLGARIEGAGVPHGFAPRAVGGGWAP